MTPLILVTGATGNTGRPVVAELLAEGYRVRALTRAPERAALPSEVEVVAGDVTSPTDVASAARGAAAVYLIWPGTDDAAAGAAEVLTALSRHVGRVVYLSANGADDGGVWGAVEQAVRSSIPEWTFLRVTGLAVNALAWTDHVHSGIVRAPYGWMRRSLVHEHDVAAVAVRALVDDGHTGRSYVLTGPEAISQEDQVRIISEEIGATAEWEEQPPDEARVALAADVGEEFADAILQAWSENAETPEPVSADVDEVLGRPAKSFRKWAHDHRADFAAGPAPRTPHQTPGKAYWINTFRAVSDPDKLAAYAELAAVVMRDFGGRFLARGNPSAAFELGTTERTTLIEFDSVEHATAAYSSDAYQHALEVLGDGAERDIRIIEGLG